MISAFLLDLCFTNSIFFWLLKCFCVIIKIYFIVTMLSITTTFSGEVYVCTNMMLMGKCVTDVTTASTQLKKCNTVKHCIWVFNKNMVFFFQMYNFSIIEKLYTASVWQGMSHTLCVSCESCSSLKSKYKHTSSEEIYLKQMFSVLYHKYLMALLITPKNVPCVVWLECTMQ